MDGLSRSLGIGICLNSWKTLNMNQDLESQASLPSCWVADLEWAEIWRLIAGDTICSFLQSPLVSKSYCSPVVAQYQQSLPSTRTTSMTSLSKLLSCKGGRMLARAQQTWREPNLPWQKTPSFWLVHCFEIKGHVLLLLILAPPLSFSLSECEESGHAYDMGWCSCVLCLLNPNFLIQWNNLTWQTLQSRPVWESCLGIRLLQGTKSASIKDVPCRAVHQVLVASNCHALCLVSIQSLRIWDGDP